MADITVTTSQLGVIYPDLAEMYAYDCAEAVTRGQGLYKTSTGPVGVSAANDATKRQARGIALNKGYTGQAITLLKRGHVEGFDVSGLNVDARLYLSNTAGAIADSAGATSIVVGRVDVINVSGTKKKVAYFNFDWNTQW